MTSTGQYKVCQCGHRDDWHQTLNPEVVLDAIQRPCYGVRGNGCDCTGWEVAYRYGNAIAHPAVDSAYNVDDVEARLTWAKVPFERVGASAS